MSVQPLDSHSLASTHRDNIKNEFNLNLDRRETECVWHNLINPSSFEVVTSLVLFGHLFFFKLAQRTHLDVFMHTHYLAGHKRLGQRLDDKVYKIVGPEPSCS